MGRLVIASEAKQSRAARAGAGRKVPSGRAAMLRP